MLKPKLYFVEHLSAHLYHCLSHGTIFQSLLSIMGLFSFCNGSRDDKAMEGHLYFLFFSFLF